ncbi:bile acid:sodium symporter family protein [Kribbella sandramycini]|uniref:BASS family bile acid:Na+ symporter n=1 Tax=Kribbella sandramycini TaxID=60450 RepID=A0A7Y4L7X6_9ACTN|nr:bile acid:sodium symporter family protein [Kribbella sandramycini]MBB6567088.1 BASS family bile acid:Na+ symporter [Kribbella sandramycini]NOL44806.1 bile acid:sodium symporter family protein [Kribbella sandramycini]
MSDSVLTSVLLPIALAIIMFGLGLSLTTGDFARVARMPKAVLVALGTQIVLLPVICFGLVELFGLAPALAVGMMLLVASPGGTTANLFSHLAGGDVALNVTLTAVNSVLAVITLPIVVNLSIAHFMGDSGQLGLQPAKMLQVFAIVLVPVALGMLVRNRKPGFADRMERPVKLGSAVVLALVIFAAIYTERANFLDYLAAVGLIAVLLNVISLGLGYAVPRAARLGERQAIACSMEIGIHNATLALAIALSPSLLNNSEMSIPVAVYGIVMFFPTAVVAYLLSRRTPAASTQ